MMDGSALPLCQRCLGLYTGAGLTALFLLISHLWRRGLPCLSIFLIQTAGLLTALLAGLHILDYGPAWRFACGLWTGHVVLWWLAGAAVHLHISQFNFLKSGPWPPTDKIRTFSFIAFITILSLFIEHLIRPGYYLWLTLSLAGLIALILTLTLVLTALIKYFYGMLPKPEH